MSINFDLLDLRAFLAVYQFRSFHEAADHLNLSQPALSRRVQSLEVKLHVALLERSTRRVLPTAAGRAFEPMARRLLEELDTSLVSIGGIEHQQSGQITIASLPSATVHFLPRIIGKFRAKFPLIRLRILDRLVADGFECVTRGEAEFGINVSNPTETDLNFQHLLDDPYVFVCHRDHPLARRRRITWHDLCGHPLISVGRAAGSGNRGLFDGVLDKANLRLNWLYEVYSFATALRLIEAGLGGAVMPRLGTPQSRDSNITTKLVGPMELTRSVGIIERRESRLSPPAQYLRDMLIADCRGVSTPEPSRSPSGNAISSRRPTSPPAGPAGRGRRTSSTDAA
jgi:DNA-binding transcriptional LysR family regulator